MNGLNDLDETYVEYSLAPTGDLVRFWRSKVKVTAGRRLRWGGEGIHVEVSNLRKEWIHTAKMWPSYGLQKCNMILGAIYFCLLLLYVTLLFCKYMLSSKWSSYLWSCS